MSMLSTIRINLFYGDNIIGGEGAPAEADKSRPVNLKFCRHLKITSEGDNTVFG